MKEFPPFRLDTVNQCLWRQGDSDTAERIPLTPTDFAVIRYLVDHPSRLVTQEELLKAVWLDTFIQPGVLKRHIFSLRCILSDDPRSPRFIETLPRRGYRFIAAVHDTAAEPVAAAAPINLVGRDREILQLRDFLRKALLSQRQIVFVTGEPGIGKTALVDEFKRRASTDSAIRTARGQCVEGYGGKEAYYPILEALGDLFRGPTGGAVVQILAEQAPTWLVQFPSLIKRQQREILQREILGATRERMLREIAEALERITAATPLLLVLEDLHWADQSTVDVISVIARGRGPAKLLLVGTYRPADAVFSENPLKAVKQDLLIHRLCHELALRPLEETEVEEFLARESPKCDPPAGFAGLLRGLSEGNPLFIVAIIEHLTRRGFISCQDGSWTLNVPLEEIELDIPGSLLAMVEAQIAWLSPEVQQTLEVASICGASFAANVTAAAATVGEEQVEDLCEELSRGQHLVRRAGLHQFPNGTFSQRYEFAHALYREVLYHRTGGGRRARVHLRIAERLEALYTQHENEIAAELAEHYEGASDWTRAVKYLRLAAESAKRRYAHREAVAILKRAAELANNLCEADRATCEIEVLEQLGMFYVARFDVGAAIEVYQKLIALAARCGLIDVEIRALLEMAFAAVSINTHAYLEATERALQLSDQQEDPLMRARTRFICFGRRAIAGRWSSEDAMACRKALDEIESNGDHAVSAEYRLRYSQIQWLSSRYGEAHRSGVENLTILLRQDEFNPYFGSLYQIYLYQSLRNLVLWGKWGQALQEVQAATALFERNRDHVRGLEARVHAALLHLCAMDFSGVVSMCEFLLPSIGLPGVVRTLSILIGSAEAALGNHDRALEQLSKVRDAMSHKPLMDDWYNSLLLQAGFVELWLLEGDLSRARHEADRFLDVALATAERTYQGLAWESSARVAMALQELTRAEECIGRALATIEEYEVPLAAWRVHGTAAELHARAGNCHLARRHREISMATIMRLADSLDSEHPLRRTFLSAQPVSVVLNSTQIRVSRRIASQ